ncbi:MAG: polyphosphate polymerase domain-containing protein [Solobacterium sp.]|nr:polyphosphate polymerase domain-containing protein [Solobacterium sp.]
MHNTEEKYRHELKYIVSAAQIALLKSRIAVMMRPDPHAGADGSYTIRSLYFDDYDNHCYYDNENGTDPREKFRIRIYNHSPAVIHLECKRKERGKTRKTSASITAEQVGQAMKGSSWTDPEGLPPLLRKMQLQMDTRLLRPVVIVEYERIPYIYQNGNVRVTFDMNMSSSAETSRFWDEDLPRRPVMPPGMHLMEVKFDEFLPDFIYRGLNLGTLRQTAYSKYYLCRKYMLKK